MPIVGSVVGTGAPPTIVLLPALAVLVVDVGMAIYCINDLYRPERRVMGGNKDLWALAIVLFSFFGILAYLSYGRER
jgi:hypothetical protein